MPRMNQLHLEGNIFFAGALQVPQTKTLENRAEFMPCSN
jgi:hypothetical protein